MNFSQAHAERIFAWYAALSSVGYPNVLFSELQPGLARPLLVQIFGASTRRSQEEP